MNNSKKRVLSCAVALVLASSVAWSADTTVGTKIDDATLTTKVKASLIDNPATKARQINVETTNGVVQLNGFVDSAAAKAEAGNTAKNIAGVKSVDNNLQIRSGGERTAGAAIDDSAITAKVKTALLSDSRTKGHEVEVKTYKGVVSLGGFVSSSEEKQAAETVAGSVQGVVKVENGIQMR